MIEQQITTRVEVQQPPVVNQIPNPNAAVDLSNAAAVGLASLQRQAPFGGPNPAYGTAFRLNAGAVNDSYMTVGGDSGGVRLDLRGGRTYTARGTFFLDAVALSGTANTRARRIVVFTKVGAAAYVETASAQAPNTASTATDLSVTFTVPVGVTEAFVRFYHGHTAGTAYWYQLRLSEGTETTFFDGASIPTPNDFGGPEYGWDGAAHTSTSRRVDTSQNVTLADAEFDSITYDTTRTPFIDATITAPLPPASTRDLLDPRRTREVVLNFRVRNFVRASPGGAFDFDLAFGTLPLGQPFQRGKLWVESVSFDWLNDRVTIRATSGENRFDDKLRLSSAPADTGATTGEALFLYALRDIGELSALGTSTADAAGLAIPAGERRLWQPGEALSTVFENELAAIDVRVWCDDRGLYSTRPFNNPPSTPGAVALSDGDSGTLVNASEEIARDAGYADATIVKATYLDGGGVSQTAWQWFPGAGPSHRKGQLVTLNRPIPAANYAASVTQRSYSRGSSWRVTAQLDFAVRPGSTVTLSMLGGTEVTVLRADSIEYRPREGTMTIQGVQLAT